MKKSYKIAILVLILLMVGFIGYNLFQKSVAMNDPYVARGEKCTYINYVCGPGTTEFYDGIGCGCKAVVPDPTTPNNTSKTYIGRGGECKYIDYDCEPGKKHFDDGIGCGCVEVTP